MSKQITPLQLDDSYQINASLVDGNVGETLVYESATPELAQVDANGLVTPGDAAALNLGAIAMVDVKTSEGKYLVSYFFELAVSNGSAETVQGSAISLDADPDFVIAVSLADPGTRVQVKDASDVVIAEANVAPQGFARIAQVDRQSIAIERTVNSVVYNNSVDLAQGRMVSGTPATTTTTTTEVPSGPAFTAEAIAPGLVRLAWSGFDNIQLSDQSTPEYMYFTDTPMYYWVDFAVSPSGQIDVAVPGGTHTFNLCAGSGTSYDNILATADPVTVVSATEPVVTSLWSAYSNALYFFGTKMDLETLINGYDPNRILIYPNGSQSHYIIDESSLSPKGDNAFYTSISGGIVQAGLNSFAFHAAHQANFTNVAIGSAQVTHEYTHAV